MRTRSAVVVHCLQGDNAGSEEAAPAQRGLLLRLNPSGDDFILQQKHEGETTLYRKMFFSHPGSQLSSASPLSFPTREKSKEKSLQHTATRGHKKPS